MSSQYADIHIHALCGVDDGAADEETMRRMIDMSWADGTRLICFTPHWHPALFSDNRERVDAAYRLAQAYVAERQYDLRLALGNELRYADNCVEWLREGFCRTLNGTRYVLVDFGEDEPLPTIIKGLNRLLSAGYKPILAHAERYNAMRGDELRHLRADGVRVQLDAASITGDFGLACKRRARRFLAEGLVDLVSSDAHDTHHRTPLLSEAREWVERRVSEPYAEALFYRNSLRILGLTETDEAPLAGVPSNAESQ